MNLVIVIPCYRVRNQISDVLLGLVSRADIKHIIVVDDGCPENSGSFVEAQFPNSKIRVLFNKENLGVGGATIAGYREALSLGPCVIVKMDGDGQMDPSALTSLTLPILQGRADYTKGNRFFSIKNLEQMPLIRIIGNAGLSLLSKISSGYWNVIDPTNGYTAIHSRVLALLPFEKINKRYFFESDMLFRLGTIRAVVNDVPLVSRYGGEISSMNIVQVAFSFPLLHLRCFVKRLFYSYLLRDINAGSLQLLFALPLILAGLSYGGYEWLDKARQGVAATSGTVMLAALPIILGFQLLLSFVLFDVNNVPKDALHVILDDADLT